MEPERAIGPWVAASIAMLIGVAYAAVLLGPSAFSGETAFWRLPGAIMNGALDIRSAISGYFWFVNDDWRWPLLKVLRPDWPDGSNAALFDSIPIVLLAGKLASSVLGLHGNPFALWTTGCFALNACAFTLLVRSLGQRGLLATIAAAGLGATAPVVQARFGHCTLLAHWLPLFMLAVYFTSVRHGPRYRTIIALCTLAALVHLYLFLMTAAIGAAAIAQTAIDKTSGFRKAALALGSIPLAAGLCLWVIGLPQALAGGQAAVDHGGFSMNLLSPIWPQYSTIGRITGIDAFGQGAIVGEWHQYEGFCFLGMGGLVLCGIALAAAPWRHAHRIRRHPVLAGTFMLLTVWAVSDHIYLGPYLVASYTPPAILADTVMLWFRAPGRFFWPIAWLMLALGLTGVMSRLRPESARIVIAAALLLQWLDITYWRDNFHHLTAQQASVFGSADQAHAVEAMIRDTGAVVVRPCTFEALEFSEVLGNGKMEVQLMAARANARMRGVYVARGGVGCEDHDPLTGPRVLVILNAPNHPITPPAGSRCDTRGAATVCLVDADGQDAPPRRN